MERNYVALNDLLGLRDMWCDYLFVCIQPQLPMTEKQMEFPELHEDSVPLFNLTIAM